MTDLLVPTKLYFPQLRSGLITRPRLIEQLNNSLDGRFTLLSAPAGFGKTTLLAEWISCQNERGRKEQLAGQVLSKIAWLSLDVHDNDLTRFWNYLVAAWQRADDAIGQSVIPRLQSSQPVPAETILALLINDLSRQEGRLGLFLDDYHLISNPAIHTALAFLLENAPPQLHLIVAGRSDPPLALSHWRVRCELNEIRATDLRFTAAETAQFLQQALERPLPETTLALLNQRTEGWPAGLQLAALSLRGLDTAATAQFVANFGGTNRHIFAYLVEEVFQRQLPLVQNFLLQTTLLDRLTAPLCDAIAEIEEWKIERDPSSPASVSLSCSQPVLEYLATNNIFLIPLDENGQWFRYHNLFAETGQARLRETQPDLIPELHRRAGRWYAANGFTEQAITHALAAQDTEMAADLIEAAANQLWTQGHLSVLLGWLGVLPEDVLLDRLNLCLLHAWLLFLHDRWAEASQRIHLAGQKLAAMSPDEPEICSYSGRWAAIQGAMAAHRQEAADAIAWMENALEHLPQDDIHWRQVAMLGLGLAQLAEGQAASAVNTLHQVALTCEQVDDIYLAFAGWWHQFEACWAQGRLREAAECVRRLEMLAERDEGNWLALRDNAAIGWAMLAYERNELETAEQQITTALPQIWPGGQPRVALQAYLTLARLAQARGDLERMSHHLEAAEQLVYRFNLTAEQRLLTIVTVRRYLAEGKLPEAYWQLENREVGPESAPDYRHEMGLLMLVRLYLAEGRANEALVILGRLLPAAELAGRDGSLIEICLLQALALAKCHQHDRALACLNRALTLAEPEHYGRIFINEGRPIVQLLNQVNPKTPYVAHLLAQMEQSPAADPLADPLTNRELEILELVAEGATNQFIADQLVISLGTVKGHLNHILSKLDAHNRTEAAARGRELGLL